MDIPSKVKKAAELLAADASLSVAGAARRVKLSETTLRRRLRSDDPLAPSPTKRPDDIMKAVAKLVA